MQAISTTTVFILLLFAILAIPCLFLISIKRPYDLVLIFLTILFIFPASTWGQIDIEITIYSRGTGLLYFPLLNWLLWIAAIVLLTVQNKSQTIALSPSTSSTPFAKYLQLFLVLILAHLVIGLMGG